MTRVAMKVRRMDGSKRVNDTALYRKSPTLQGLTVTSRAFANLPVVGADSWVRPLGIGGDCVFIQCGIAYAQSS